MAIKVEKLEKTYRVKGGADTQALKGVSFSFPDTGMIFILGKSGCGKSTLLNVLGGLDGFDSGDIVVDGKSMKGYKAKDFDHYRNRYVGFVFQENNLLEEYTVKRNVGLALDLQSQKGADEQIESVLESVELKDFAPRKCNSISGGQKQRVAIARALIKQPKMLLCDEPTGALDSETGEDIFNLLKNISKQKLVVVVSHDRESAEKYGDRIIELKDGQILSDTAPLTEAPAVQETQQKKRCGVPFARALTFGLDILKARPVRFIICILICLVTFISVGTAATVYSYDYAEATVNTMEVTGSSHVKLVAYHTGSKYYSTLPVPESAEKLSKMFNTRFDLFYTYNGSIASYPVEYGSDDALYNHLENKFMPYGAIVIDDKFAQDYGFTLYGSLPTKADEVVIPLHIYKAFEKVGYTENRHLPGVIKINSVEDIIGKSIAFYGARTSLKVTGVLDTKVNEKRYGQYLYENCFNGQFSKEIEEQFGEDGSYMLESMHCTMFVAPEFIENWFSFEKETRFVVTPLPESRKTNVEYARGITLETDDEGERSFWFETNNEASRNMRSVDDIMIVLKTVFLWVTVAVVVVSILFMLYYISGVISEKRRQIGILRALGASSMDILKIFGLGIGTFALALIAVAAAGAAVIAVLLNSVLINELGVTVMVVKFGFVHFAFMFGVAVLSVILGVAMPIVGLLRAKPVDVIAGRK